MPIPKHNEIRIPVLEFLKKNGASASKQMIGPMSEFLKENKNKFGTRAF